MAGYMNKAPYDPTADGIKPLGDAAPAVGYDPATDGIQPLGAAPQSATGYDPTSDGIKPLGDAAPIIPAAEKNLATENTENTEKEFLSSLSSHLSRGTHEVGRL